MKDWKACECKVAGLLGGVRILVSWRGRGHSPDIHHGSFSIEVKSHKKLPAWLEDVMRQAEAFARDGQLPVAVLYQDRCKYRGSFIVCRLGGFVGYLKEGSA